MAGPPTEKKPEAGTDHSEGVVGGNNYGNIHENARAVLLSGAFYQLLFNIRQEA